MGGRRRAGAGAGMKDRRSVGDLSIDELQQALSEKKRQAREARLARFRETGRALPPVPVGERPQPLPPERPAAPPPAGRGRRLADAALLLVEVAAVLGLGSLLYNGKAVLDNLNREAAQAMAQQAQGLALPTAPATPVITAVVLPSGHTPPTAAGGAQFNVDEVPLDLRPLLQAVPAVAAPTQGPTQARRIIIPAINVDAPIVPGDGWEQLKKGVGQHLGGGDPGQAGNVVLSAHNDIFGEIFRHLDQLQPGDEVQIHTLTQAFTYVVTGTRLVAPTEVGVLAPTADATLTLISCYPYLVDTQRIVVVGALKTP